MPNIPIFNAPFPQINVSDRAEEAFRTAARQIGVIGREGVRELSEGIDKAGIGIADAGRTLQQHQDFTDRMTGVRSLASLKQNDITELGKIVANTSPDDMPNALASFNQRVGDRLNQWQTQFAGSSRQTQLWATEQSSQYQTEQAHRFAADSAINAGNKTILDIGHTANSISGSLSQNPTSAEIDSGLKMWDQQTQALSLSPYITDPSMKARINKDMEAQRGQFIQTAIQKAIAINPDAGAPLISRYGQYLSPEQQRALESHQDQQTKAQFWQDRARQEDLLRQQKQDASRALTGLTQSTFQTDAQGVATGQRIIPPDYFSKLLSIGDMPGADHATLKAAATDAQEILNRQKNGVIATTDPKTYQALFAKSYAGLTDQDVFQAHANGQLSDHDATMFHQAVQDAQRNPQMADAKRQFDFMVTNFAKPFLVKSDMMNPDPTEFQRLQQFENDKWALFQDGLRKNLSAHDLLDQRNPNFIGGDVTRYQLTPEQKLKGVTDRATTGSQPIPPVIPERMPNESPADYLKRTQPGATPAPAAAPATPTPAPQPQPGLSPNGGAQ